LIFGIVADSTKVRYEMDVSPRLATDSTTSTGGHHGKEEKGKEENEGQLINSAFLRNDQKSLIFTGSTTLLTATTSNKGSALLAPFVICYCVRGIDFEMEIQDVKLLIEAL